MINLSENIVKGVTGPAEFRENGIISTPKHIVVEMVDKIPVSCFLSDKTTFFDPACGYGTFLKYIYVKLREHGHSHENSISRIYGLDKFSPANETNDLFPNIMKKDFISDMPKQWPDKFDVIVSNPPYGGGSNGGRGAGSGKSIWQSFILKSFSILSDDGKMCFIHPEDWRASVPGVAKTKGGKKDKEEVYKILTSGILRNLKMWGEKAFGPSVGTSVDSWVLDKGYFGECNVEYKDGTTSSTILSKKSTITDFNGSSIESSVLRKAIIEGHNNGILLRKTWSGLKILDKNFPAGEYKFAHGSRWTEGEWVIEEYPHIHQNLDKVVVCEIRLPRAKYFRGEDSVGISDHVHYWLVENKEFGKSLEAFCNSKVVNYLRIKTLPMIMPFWIWSSFDVDFRKKIENDQDVYEHMGLSKEEINEIEIFINETKRK